MRRMVRVLALLAVVMLAGAPLLAPGSASAQARAQEQHYGATFEFDPGVSELDKYSVIEGIRLGQLMIAQNFGIDRLANLRIKVLSDVSGDGDTTLATTFGSEIEVYTSSDVWQSLSSIERVETLVHELFHVYQNLMIQSAIEPELAWFAEGTADAVGFAAVLPLGVTSQDEVYNMMSYMLTQNPISTPFSELEGFDSMQADAYPLAYMATQYLLGSRGLPVGAIGTVYEGLAAGKPFAQAFQDAFGVTPQDFYTEFEAWRPGIVQTLRLDDDFWAEEVSATASAFVLDPLPAQVASTGQLTVTGQTAPDVSCELTVAIGPTTLQRPAESNSSGEVYWLVSMPEGTAVNTGTLTASCGAAPVSGSFAIAA